MLKRASAGVSICPGCSAGDLHHARAPALSADAWRLDPDRLAAGLERFPSIAFKSWLSVQAAIVLAASTPFPELLVAMRAVRIPRLLVAIFGLMWRYLFVLVDEAIAHPARSRFTQRAAADPELKTGGSLAWRGTVAGGMAGSLFLRAFERSDRIYMAMLSRGYDGEMRAMPLPALGPQPTPGAHRRFDHPGSAVSPGFLDHIAPYAPFY